MSWKVTSLASGHRIGNQLPVKGITQLEVNVKALKEALDHKKFAMAVLMAIIAFLGQFFTALAQFGDVVQALAAVDWAVVVAPITVAIGAQGLADLGKERAKIDAETWKSKE